MHAYGHACAQVHHAHAHTCFVSAHACKHTPCTTFYIQSFGVVGPLGCDTCMAWHYMVNQMGVMAWYGLVCYGMSW